MTCLGYDPSEQAIEGNVPLDERSKPRGPVSSDEPLNDGAGPPCDPPDEVAPSVEEQRVLEQARAGDRDAFRRLVELHQDRVFRLVRRMMRCDRDTAADFTQEVFLRVFRGLPSFDGRSKFTTWLYKIVQNIAISDHRAKHAQKRNKWTFSLDAPVAGSDDLLVEPEAGGVDPVESSYHAEVAERVREAVQELPDDFRSCVIMRDLQGMSYEEIAEVIGVPPGTVRSRIHRGRVLLQQKLREFRP